MQPLLQSAEAAGDGWEGGRVGVPLTLLLLLPLLLLLEGAVGVGDLSTEVPINGDGMTEMHVEDGEVVASGGDGTALGGKFRDVFDQRLYWRSFLCGFLCLILCGKAKTVGL